MPGARGPEELDTLLEDAVLLGDAAAVARLAGPGAVLVGGPGPGWRWPPDRGYVADPRRVVAGRDVALILGSDAVHVARRDRGGWRFAITVLGQRCSCGHHQVERPPTVP